MTLSHEFVNRDAYLVSRGVRPAAIVGFVLNTPVDIREALSIVLLCLSDGWGYCETEPIPFTMRWRLDPNLVAIGVAGYPWIPPILEWLSSDAVPEEHYDRLLGLILGYSPASVEAFHQGQISHEKS